MVKYWRASPFREGRNGKKSHRSWQEREHHFLVDQRAAPLAVYISGANQHDQWFVDELVFFIVVVRRSSGEQRLCADEGCDYPDVHHFVLRERYVAHIKYCR